MPDGVAVLQPDGSDVGGVVRFDEMFDESGKTVIGVHITYRITGLTDGEHGFHIHRYGDLTDGCTSACEHFDPRAQELETEIASFDSALDRDTMGQSSREYSIRTRNHWAQVLENRHHGSLKSQVRHFGDLGNIKSKGGISEGGLFLAKACLRDDPSDWRSTKRLHSILGRMIIVHADRDDLGKGGLKNGEIIDEAVHQESLKTGNAGKRLACGVIGLADPNSDIMTMEAEDVLPRKCRECGTTDNITTIQTGTFCFDCLPINLGAEEFSAEDNYDSTYGKEQAKIRRRLKNKLMGEATMGTKAGQWSARKSQELKRRYEAACERKGIKPYKGSKTTKQKDLSNWSKQGWRTASGRKSSVTGEPYFPTKAVKALKDKELYAKAKRQKAAATRAGKQRATYSKDIQAVVARYRAEGDNDDEDDLPTIGSRWRRRVFDWRLVDEWIMRGGDPQYALSPGWTNERSGDTIEIVSTFSIPEYDFFDPVDRIWRPGRIGNYVTFIVRGHGIPKQEAYGDWRRKLQIPKRPSVNELGVISIKTLEKEYLPEPTAPTQMSFADIGHGAEDYASETIDDLDSNSLVTRMDAIGILLDEIVQKHGGSYEKAERDPIYLRLVGEHTALARAYARREGFGAEDFTITEPPMDIAEEAQARLEAIRQLQWGIRAIERMLREGNIDDAKEFARITIDAMQQEENAARDLGLDPDRFSAEDEDLEVCVNCGTTREERSVQPHRLDRGETKSTYKLGICYNCDRCNDCCWMICDDDSQDESYDIKYDQGFGAESDPVSTTVYIGPGNHLSVAEVIDSDHFVLIDSQPRTEYEGGEHEMYEEEQHYFMDQLMGMAKALNYEVEDFKASLNDQNAARMTFKTPSGQIIDYYYNSVYPFADGQEIPEVMESLSTADRLIIAGYHPAEQLLDDMPNLDLVYLYENTHYPTEKNDHFDDLGNPTVIKGFFERGDESHPSALQFVIMGKDEDYESGNITDQYIEKGPFGGSGITWEYPEAAEQIERNKQRQYDELRKIATGKDWWEAESDPVSSVAAGTTDALNDFANSQDTDDKFYFLGGLVGGLAIAVLGNIISDRLQDVYFPHWWDNRGGSKS